ncbi:hypothetical protein IGI04_040548 [Brassica rapa subsp. trilocularis]|uniref:Uncharacterized protein n=1 Tax=Brassica rapa subsp. trilocularis TaxID=1813537 RepID=A0ABQ7KN61_BRACM|nr:hypothetical protein IGI04_040548 [Brassica rapa subsp. trilocularis]
MEGSPYWKLSISWKGARFQTPNSGLLLAGTWSVPLSGTRGSGSYLEAGGNEPGVFSPTVPLRQDPVPLVLLACVPLKPELILNPDFQRLPFLPYIFFCLFFPVSALLAFPYLRLMYFFSSLFAYTFPALALGRFKEKNRFSGSRSDSSPDPGTGSEHDLAAPPSICVCVSSADSTRVTGSSFIPGQITVYEAFFDIGFRGVIPVLVASLCDFFGISPSQLNPPSWRLLVAIQNLGDLENLSFGINEVMFSYHLAPLNGNEGRLHLRPRSGLPIVEELQKGDRKGSAFSKKWQEQYVFVMLPGHSYHWTFLAGMHPVLPEGEDTVLRARQLPLDRPQVPCLLSDSALHRSSLWGNMSGNTSNDPFAAYQEAAKVMSSKKGSASRTVSVDDLMITSSRRVVTVKIEHSALVKTKKSRGGGMATRSLRQSAEVAHSVGNLATALSNLNVQTISQLFHFGEQLSIEGSLVSREELDDLKRQVLEETAQRVAREMEIRDLKDKLKDAERAAEVSSADALSIGKKNQELEEAMETLRLEMVMAVNGARVPARWKLIREWLQKKSNQWDMNKALEQYKTVALEEAQNKGAPVPTFEDKPAARSRVSTVSMLTTKECRSAVLLGRRLTHLCLRRPIVS